MKQLLLLFILSISAFGVSNKVTLQDKSGFSHGTRQFVIPRYFAENEICSIPKPYIGGTPVSYWQSHVDNRWPASSVCPGGSAKFAIIIIETELLGGSTVDVYFRNSTDACHLGSSITCAAAGMTKQELLDFDSGGGTASWGAKIQATTGGITMSRSARTMISSDHYQIIRNGPIYAEVLVREGPDAVSAATTRTTNFGWKCTANCVAPYTTSTWTEDASYYSIRPSFWLRFYRRWQKVEVDFVGNTGWMDRFVDQRIESWEFLTGGNEDIVSASSNLPFVLSPRHTWWDGPFWNGAEPLRSNIDFNTSYLVASRMIPPLKTDSPPSAASIAMDVNSFASSDQGATTTATLSPKLGVGQTNPDISQGAANPFSTGLFPVWTSRYLATMDADMFDVVIGNAKGIMHFPIVFLESKTSGTWTAGSTASPFGKVVSIELRPTFVSWYGGTNNTLGTDRVTSPDGVVMSSGCAGCYVYSSAGTWASAGGGSTNPQYMDKSHQSTDLFIPYVITGKRLFLEQLQAQAAWNVAAQAPNTFYWNILSPTYSTHNFGRQYERGLIESTAGYPRAGYWPLKGLGWAAVISPDGSPEKIYFDRLLNNNIEVTEGVLQLTNGSFPPTSYSAPYGCPSTSYASYYGKPSSYASAWCQGRYVWMNGYSNPLGFPGLHTTVPFQFTVGSMSDVRYGMDEVSAWMMAYGAVTYGHLRDLGVSKIGPIQEAMSKWFMYTMADSASGRDWSVLYNYRVALMNPTSNGVIQTPLDLRRSSPTHVKLARAASNTTTVFYGTGLFMSGNSPFPFTTYFGGSRIQVGSEIFMQWWQYPRSIRWSGGVSSATDQITFTDRRTWAANNATTMDNTTGVHDFTDGDLITLSNGVTYEIKDLPLAADPDNCASPSGKAFCTYYVKVINTTTIEVYKDSALTQKVDFTSDLANPGLYAGLTEWRVETAAQYLGRCGGITCRGQGSAITSHAVGETIGPVGSWMRDAYMLDGDGYPHEYRTSLAYAASYPVWITDSLTGERMSGSRAYGIMNGMVGYQDRYTGRAGGGTCAGLWSTNCGNVRWGWISWPEVAPTNVRVIGGTGTATLRWVAPDGGACSYNIASSLDNPDDSSDPSDGGGHTSRKVTVNLAAGTYVYRISCGSGRYIGLVNVQ